MSPEELFGQDDQVVLSTVGSSMRPLLLSGRDTVVLQRVGGRLQPGDVALYQQPDGTLVLHRVLRQGPEGYVFLGDNQRLGRDEETVCPERLLAVMTGFFRRSRYYSADCLAYRLYRGLCMAGGPGRSLVRGLWKCRQAWKRAPIRHP